MKRYVLTWSVGFLALASSAWAQQPAPEPEPSTAPNQPTTSAEQSALEKDALEKEFSQALASDPAAKASTGGATLSLLDLAFDLLSAAGTSTANEAELPALEAGGHDPKVRGFTIQNAELTLSGVVDPYLRGDVSIVLQIDSSGESTIELEEAYLTTLDLPFNLQVKAGQFFGAFGRINTIHPHGWDFVDAPVVTTRLLGAEGFRNPGAQISWLTPLPFFAELIASVQNSQGETAPSFRYAPGELVAGRTLIERGVRGLGDLAYLARLRTSFDLGDEVSIVPGASALFGPNATADDTHTQIYGADLYLKWKPLKNDRGWPFVAWQSEALVRSYQAAAVFYDDELVDKRRTLDDLGFYSQLLWGFARPWNAGVRFDYARGQADVFRAGRETYSTATDPMRDRRQRYSGVLTFYPSEFSKLRLQYNLDHAQFLPDHVAHSVFAQVEILLGAHGAHKF